MVEISALMSVYNGEKFIRSTIESILNQTYRHFEFIIINDGSKDQTKEIIESYKDPRIKLYNFPINQGLGAALQFALTKSKGKYIARVDADDLYREKRFEIQKYYLDDNPKVALVGTFIEYFSDDENVRKTERYKCFKEVIEKQKRIIEPHEIKEEIYKYCCVTHSTIMVRSEVIKSFGYKSWKTAEDYKLFYDLNKSGYIMKNIPEILTKVRLHSNSTTAIADKLYNLELIYKIKREEINGLFNPQHKVYIWGCGSFGKNVLKVLDDKGLRVQGFIDSNPKMHSCGIDNKIVYSPEILNQKEKGYKIIVASQAGKFSIEKTLVSLGYTHLQDYLIYQ